MASPLKRLSRIRTTIFVVIVVFAVLGFALHLGPVGFLFRGVLYLGVLALLGSYVWGFYLKWRRSQ